MVQEVTVKCNRCHKIIPEEDQGWAVGLVIPLDMATDPEAFCGGSTVCSFDGEGKEAYGKRVLCFDCGLDLVKFLKGRRLRDET